MGRSDQPLEERDVCPKSWGERACIHPDGDGHLGLCTYASKSAGSHPHKMHQTMLDRLELHARRLARAARPTDGRK